MSEIKKDLTLSSLRIDPTSDNTSIAALDVEGPVTMTKTLDVTGNTTVTGNLSVTGNSTLTGGLFLSQANAVQAVAVPDEAAAATASRILTTATIVTLTPDNDANDRAYLPSPTSVGDGKVYIIQTTATGCELSAEGDGTTPTTINGTEVTNAAGAYAKELALAASSTFIAVKTGANAWTVTPGAAAPDP